MPTSWWNDEYNSSWERAKDAFRRDWEQTKHDFGGDGPDLHQELHDTVRQAMGFEESEPALRFGHGARLHYGTRKWDEAFANEVSKEYEGDWQRDQPIIRYSYDRTTRA